MLGLSALISCRVVDPQADSVSRLRQPAFQKDGDLFTSSAFTFAAVLENGEITDSQTKRRTNEIPALAASVSAELIKPGRLNSRRRACRAVLINIARATSHPRSEREKVLKILIASFTGTIAKSLSCVGRPETVSSLLVCIPTCWVSHYFPRLPAATRNTRR